MGRVEAQLFLLLWSDSSEGEEADTERCEQEADLQEAQQDVQGDTEHQGDRGD